MRNCQNLKQVTRVVSQKGQATLFALILGVLGLTVGLSVASRSLSDLKQASFTDFGTKALAASEAGAEYGLNQISLPGFSLVGCQSVVLYDPNAIPPITTLNFAGLQMKKVEIDICSDTSPYFLETGVPKDGVSQVDFTGVAALPSKIDVLWNNADSVEITVLKKDYSVARYAYNAPGVSGTNNFSPGQNNPSCSAGPTCDNPNSLASGPFTACTGPAANIDTSNALLVRVKPIGGGADVQVCGIGQNIPGQSYLVTAKATTTNGTVRRVQVKRGISGVLPSEFDNVLYSGGSIIK